MDMVFNIGLMVLTMKVTGAITKPTVKVHSGMQRATCTEVTLEMTWPMVMENTHILMAQNIKVSLEMMFKKDTEKRNGLMELNTLGLTRME